LENYIEMRRIGIIVAAVLMALVSMVVLLKFFNGKGPVTAGDGRERGTRALVDEVETGRKSVSGKKARSGQEALSLAGAAARLKYESALSSDTNILNKLPDNVQPQYAKMLADVKTARQLVEYLRKTGDFEGATRKLAEFASNGQVDIEDLTKALSPDDSEDVVMFVTMGLADIGTEKAVSSLFSVFESMPENSDIKRDVGEIIVSVTNTVCKKLMIDTMLSVTNPEASDIAQRALANMADKDVILALLDGYLGAVQETQKELFADTVRHMRNPELVPALKYIVDGEKDGSFDMIGLAACDTLGIIGTREATACLMESYKTLSDESTLSAVYAAITKISNAESLDILLGSARDVNMASKVRLASIVALRNYDYGLVGEPLQEILSNAQDAAIREEARKSLEKALKDRSR
jgi:hypothetical protein